MWEIFNTGDQVELTIDSVNHQGEGVGRFQGIAVFVPFTVPGERVSVRIKEIRKNYATGEVVDILTSSEARIAPQCTVFGSCGGSRLQHIAYDRQLELKQKNVRDTLTRIGKVKDPVVHYTLGMQNPWGYRNKVHFQVMADRNKIKLGFFEEGTHSLVSTTACLLVDKEISDVAGQIEKMLNDHQIKAFDWNLKTGLLRHVVIRKGLNTGEIMVVLVTAAERPPALFDFARKLVSKVSSVRSIVQNINNGKTRQVFGTESVLLAGQMTITEKLGGLTFKISPTSFFQVNSLQTEILYKKALEYAQLTGQETVLDVYCGIGTISLFLARKAARVYGFEVSREAVDDAAENAALNRISNVEFVAGKAEDQLPKLVERGVKPEIIVVDPPRQGIEKRAIQAIVDMNPRKIVYVSCDPATLARDVNLLQQEGYELKEVQPVDMFPQTSHVECIVLMTNCGQKGK